MSLPYTFIGILLVWFALVGQGNAYGQLGEQTLDSLTQILQGDAPDTAKARTAFILVGDHFPLVDPDSGIALAHHWLAICQAEGWTDLKAEGEAALLATYNRKGYYDSTLILSEQLIEDLQQQQVSPSFLEIITGVYIRRGVAYGNLARYPEATKEYLQALTYAETDLDTGYIIMILNNLGTVHNNLDDYAEARRYFNQAYEVAKAYRNPHYSIELFEEAYYFNLAYIYDDEEKFDSARMTYQKAIAIYKRRGSTFNLAMGYINLGDTFTDLQQLDSASYYLQLGLDLARDLGQVRFKFTTFTSLIEIAIAQEEWYTALRYVDSCRMIAEAHESALFWKDYYQASWYVHEAKGDYRQALEARNQYEAWEDSVSGQEQINAINQWKARYVSQKQENEILKLSQKNLQQELDLERRDRLIIRLMLTFLFVAILGATAYVVMQQRQRIREQKAIYQAIAKTELAEQNRIAQDLHDSMGALLGTIAQRVAPATQASDSERQTYQLVKKAGEEMRRISHNLMPTELMKFGLKAAIDGMVTQVSNHQLKTQFHAFGELDDLSILNQLQIFRITQELVQNAVKHAEASMLSVQLTRHEDYLNLLVEDNGKGFDQQQLKEGLGFQSLRNRVNLLQGSLHIDSSPTRGTSVSVDIPITSSSSS